MGNEGCPMFGVNRTATNLLIVNSKRLRQGYANFTKTRDLLPGAI